MAAEAEHEAGRAAHQHRERRQDIVQPRVLAQRGEDAEGDPQEQRDGDCRRHQQQGRRNAPGDLLRDRVVRRDGIAEVTLQDAAQPDGVADRHGLVEAQLVAALLQDRGIALQLRQDRGIQARRQWVARGQGQRQEADHRDAQQDRERDEDAPERYAPTGPLRKPGAGGGRACSRSGIRIRTRLPEPLLGQRPLLGAEDELAGVRRE